MQNICPRVFRQLLVRINYNGKIFMPDAVLKQIGFFIHLFRNRIPVNSSIGLLDLDMQIE